MDGPRDELFSRPALARDEDGDIRARDLFNLVVDETHGSRRTDDVLDLVAIAEIRLECHSLVGETIAREDPLEGGLEELLVDGLDQIVVGAELGEFHRPTDLVHGREDEDRQVRMAAFDLLQDIHPIDLRHHEIEDHRARWRIGTGEDLGAPGKGLHLVAGRRNDDVEQLPNRRLVVNHPHPGCGTHDLSSLASFPTNPANQTVSVSRR